MFQVKVGILINNFENLKNWELRIIEHIQNDAELKIVSVIRDGRKNSDPPLLSKTTEQDNYGPFSLLSEKLLRYQLGIERRRYQNKFQQVDRDVIFKHLKSKPLITLKPNYEGSFDVFNTLEIQKINSLGVDLLLKFGFNRLKGEIIKIPKFGIWYLNHSEVTSNGKLPGFWEILNKQDVVCSSLTQLMEDGNSVRVIENGFFNRHRFSLMETITKVEESSVSIVVKNLNSIKREKRSITNSEVILVGKPKNISVVDVSIYIGRFYANLFRGMLKQLLMPFGYRKNHWSLFIGSGEFMESELFKIQPNKLPRDEFWADPFMIRYKNDSYVFFENYSFKRKIGKISCGKIENNKIIQVTDALVKDYHLSYPFIINLDGEIYMIPESSQNKRLEIYKCVNFPNKWQLYATAFEGEIVQDASFYKDENEQLWLFVNKSATPYVDHTAELHIYKVSSIKCESLEAHPKNPVMIDSRVARNGGMIFKYKNEIYRPSQGNTEGVYGKSLNINIVKKLDLEDYEEFTVKKIDSNSLKGIVASHHLHQTDFGFVFDAY